MKRHFLVRLIVGIVFPLNASALTLNIDNNGYLLGASEVDVEGVLYDVAFTQGSCFEVFGDCDDPANDFMFNTVEAANAASAALLAQVFVDGPSGNFDTDSDLIGAVGSTSTTIYTPTSLINVFFDTQVWGSTAFNGGTSGGVDSASSGLITLSINNNVGGVDVISMTAYFWADWTLSQPAPVPVPAAFWLFGSGLIGLIGVARRKKS